MKPFYLSLFCLFIVTFLSESKSMPDIIPNDFKVSYGDNGGMSPAYTSIVLTKEQSVYENEDTQRNKTKITFSVTTEELKELYELIKEIRFENIKTKKPSHIVYDAGSEGISATYSGFSSSVSSGANSIFKSDKDRQKYIRLRNKIFDIFSVNCSSKDKSPEAKKLIKKLASYDTVCTAAIGVAGIKPDEYKTFEELSSLLDAEDWFILSEHSNPVVKAYAFWALLRLKDPKWLRFFDIMSYNKAKVNFSCCCKNGKRDLNTVLVEELGFEKTDFLSAAEKDYLLTIIYRINK